MLHAALQHWEGKQGQDLKGPEIEQEILEGQWAESWEPVLLLDGSCCILLLSRYVLAFSGRVGFSEEREKRTEKKLEGKREEIKGNRRQRKRQQMAGRIRHGV